METKQHNKGLSSKSDDLQNTSRKERDVLIRELKKSSFIKRETFYALENTKLAKQPFKFFGYFLFALIVANAVVVFSTVEPSSDSLPSKFVSCFYAFSTACFCLEFFARIWIADLAFNNLSKGRARAKYIFSLWGLIDFMSFFPSILLWFFPQIAFLRNALNLIRLVRLIKISRYMRGLRTIGRVLIKRRSEIVASILVLALLIFLSSVAMYEIEHPAQPNIFNNMLSGLYWAVTTITSTGYGDIVPITPAGRVVGSIIMFLSVALIAIPGGIFSAGFVAEFRVDDRPKIQEEQNIADNTVEPDSGESQTLL